MWAILIEMVAKKALTRLVATELSTALLVNPKNLSKVLGNLLKSPKKLGLALKNMKPKQLEAFTNALDIVKGGQLKEKIIDLTEQIKKATDPLQKKKLKEQLRKTKETNNTQELGNDVKSKVVSSWIGYMEWRRIGKTKSGLPSIEVFSTGKKYDFKIPMTEEVFKTITMGVHAGTKFHALYWRKIGYGKKTSRKYKLL